MGWSSTGASLAQTSGGASSWLLSDPFANTVATVSTTGSTLSGTSSLNAFGVPMAAATGQLADATTGFAGQYLDDATGLYDMRARDYDPTSGRFSANDPVAIPTGMPYVAGYSYSRNNPLMYTDVSGLFCIPIGPSGYGDCRTVGERFAPDSDLTAGLVDGTVEHVVSTGYGFSPEGMSAGWDSFQQERGDNGNLSALAQAGGGGLAIDGFTNLAACIGPVICNEHDMASEAAGIGLTLAETELMLATAVSSSGTGACRMPGLSNLRAALTNLMTRVRAVSWADDLGAVGPGVGDLRFARSVRLDVHNPAVANRGMTVLEFVGKHRDARILREFPGEFLNQTVEEALTAGNSKVRKLLTDGRWRT